MASQIYEELIRRANYALRSQSRNLVYETYGAAKMAHTLKAITKDESVPFKMRLAVLSG